MMLGGCSQRKPAEHPDSSAAVPSTAPAAPEEIQIYVPCGLAGPYGDVAKLFAQEHPDIKLRRKLENELPLCNRIRDGESPDVFLSLGERELVPLTQKDRIVEGSLVRLARDRLALAAPPGNPLGLKTLEDLARPEVKRIAIGEPGKISVGFGAQEALEKAGLWTRIQAKVMKVSLAAYLLKYTAEGKVDAAIVYKSCLGEVHQPGEKPKETNVTYVGDVPADLHEPIHVVAVQIQGGPNPQTAQTFLDFLARPEVQKVFTRWFLEGLEEPTEDFAGQSLFVHAGAGLRKPMDEIARLFKERYGVQVRFNYTGSACLLAQIMMTQRGDLYLPGEEFYLEQAKDRGYVKEAKIVAYFVPVILVQKGNPKNIQSLADLAQPGLRLALGDPKTCAVGKIADQILEKNGLKKAVSGNIKTYTITAPELGNAIKLGSVDATINWDAVAAWCGEDVTVIPIPPEQNVTSACPLGILKWSQHPALAQKFLDFVASEGRRVFEKHHYTLDLSRPVYACPG